MKRWGRLALAVLLAAWTVGGMLRIEGRLPGPWWLWAAPYLLVLAALLAACLLLALAKAGLWLAVGGRDWLDRRADERLRRSLIRSLEADFLRRTGLSGRAETPPRRGPSTVTILLPPPRPPRTPRRQP